MWGFSSFSDVPFDIPYLINWIALSLIIIDIVFNCGRDASMYVFIRDGSLPPMPSLESSSVRCRSFHQVQVRLILNQLNVLKRSAALVLAGTSKLSLQCLLVLY